MMGYRFTTSCREWCLGDREKDEAKMLDCI